MHQIVLIPSCRDVLALVKDGKYIKRISCGSLVTFLVSAKLSNETYLCVGPGGEQAYACAVHKCEVNLYCRDYKISLLDQFGRILRTFSVQLIKDYLYYHQGFVTDEKKTLSRNRPTISGISSWQEVY